MSVNLNMRKDMQKYLDKFFKYLDKYFEFLAIDSEAWKRVVLVSSPITAENKNRIPAIMNKVDWFGFFIY